jgi:hypothetical protein
LRRLGCAAFRLGHAARAERIWALAAARGMPDGVLAADRAQALGGVADRLAARGGRPAAALAALRLGAALAPGDAAAQLRPGRLLLRWRDPVAAEPWFRAALALDDGLAEAHLGLSAALWRQRRRHEALAAARVGLARHPADPWLRRQVQLLESPGFGLLIRTWRRWRRLRLRLVRRPAA